MKLLCLGTGAADWKPEKRVEGEEWRHFTSTLADGRLLIDPGPHIFEFRDEYGDPALFDGVTDILVTHTHGDHFSLSTVRVVCENKPVTLWGTTACAARLATLPEDVRASIRFCELPLLTPARVGAYTVVAMPSNHSTDLADEVTVHYDIFDGEKRLFYGLDGGWLTRRQWLYMKTVQYDAMILDGTVGEQWGDPRIFEHNSLPMLRIMIDTFRSSRVLKYGTGRIFADHMARSLHPDHAALTAKLAPLDVTPCRDGMTIEI